MEELRQRIQQKYKNPLFDTHGDGDKEEQPQTVNIILFNTGTEQQGAHSIEFPKGSGNNMILAFESKQACRKFADSLKEQNFFDPTVSEINRPPTRLEWFHTSSISPNSFLTFCVRSQPQEFELEELNAMCETLGVFVQVVPEGVEIIPPLHNVKHLGHNPKLQNEKNYLNYIFEMTDDNLDDLEDNIDVDDGGSWD
jgi:hypothetical protein